MRIQVPRLELKARQQLVNPSALIPNCASKCLPEILHPFYSENKVSKLPGASGAESTIIRWKLLATNQVLKAEHPHAVLSNAIVPAFCKKSKSPCLHNSNHQRSLSLRTMIRF